MTRLTRRRFATLAAAGLVAGCGPRGAITMVDAPVGLDGTVAHMIVATSRREVEGQPIFTRARATPPTFATFDVWVPPDRAVGSVKFPDEQPPDLATDFATLRARRLSGEAAFIQAVNASLAANPGYEGRVSLFVHGFNTNFAEGLYRHAQIYADYGKRAAPVQFAWPSAASTKGYIYDRESVLYSRDALESTIAALTRTNAREINLIAHSMGALLMMETLRTMARFGYPEVFARINAVLLLSPDIEIDVFRTQAPPVVARGAPIFVVVSTRDRALMLARIVRTERTPRVGAISSPQELGIDDVTVIDLSNVDAGGGMGHFALARSPELIGLLRGLGDNGIDVLEESRQRGLFAGGVSLIQQGADMLVAPLAPMGQ
ncbi:alpha/beta hydrolase [Amaricoccus sp.]|uniref:alpha/beta hydrolase n=1 Tax=Amaricoccus sp. TaxID=1872485 RepID=UPI001B6EF64D|nr:alpha/beta hydrolase [Amaricoccus sp.]MBP7242263.1 alpha/beta fold hydrolase [Amaricoccus sp.]